MKNSFNDLGIMPPILRALDEMGFEKPTEVQSKAIPHILNKEDLIVMSKTGSGKTAVFGVSMLQQIDPNASEPQGLILTPTRELAVQVNNELRKMAKHTRHKTTAVYGQHNMNVEIQALNRGVSIVTGTPGRVNDHIQSKNLNTQNIRFLVLDEADRMLDMGFLDQVVNIIRTLPRDRITLLFSATIPHEIRRICKKYMKQPTTLEIKSETKTVDSIEQIYYRVEKQQKNTVLNHLLLMERPESCMIFCNTRADVNKIQNFLYRKGYNCQALHGDIPQAKRMKTIQQFKQGEFHLLVATDVAARGIHIDNLSLVINYDVPQDRDNYIHRIGRTGRAGNSGRALSLVTSDDIMSLYSIEEHIGTRIVEGELPTKEMYDEQKSEADKWVRAHSWQGVNSKPDSGSNTKRPTRSGSGYNPNRAAKPDSGYNANRSTRPDFGANFNRPPKPDLEANSNKPPKSDSGYNANRATKSDFGANTKRPPKPYNGPDSKKPSNNQYPKKSNQHYNKHNDRNNDNYRNYKNVKKTEPAYTSPRQKRPIKQDTKVASKHITDSVLNNVNHIAEAKKNETVKENKSIIQRLLQKIIKK